MRVLMRMISRFGSDRRGNVAVIFTLACLPLVTAVGCAVEYTRATQMRSKLQAAIDSASVGSVAQNSPGFLAAATMQTDGNVSAGATDATNIFNANMSSVSGYTLNNLTPTMTKSGSTVTTTITFSASMPTVFLGVIGKSSMTLSGSSKASASLPLYLDFYLMLDVSGSMGLPSTNSEQTRLSAVNPDMYVQYNNGCTLACHFTPQNGSCGDSWSQGYPTNNYCLGYAISRVSQSGYKSLLTTNNNNPMGVQLPSSMVSGLPNSLYTALPPVSSCSTAGTDSCIQLRLDAVGYAVNQLFVTANASERVTNQFRIGLYPFIRYLDQDYFPLTASINGSPTNPSTINYAAANLASLLDTNTNSDLGSGGTHIDTALTSMNSVITSVGNGSTSSNTLPYVFLITDGAEDPQTKGVPNGSWAGSNHATVIDPTTVCTPLKNRGIIVSVLYIPYEPIQNPNASFANDEDDYANNNIANIPTSLQNCASQGFFYTANAPADITAALNAMFAHALITAHITN